MSTGRMSSTSKKSSSAPIGEVWILTRTTLMLAALYIVLLGSLTTPDWLAHLCWWLVFWGQNLLSLSMRSCHPLSSMCVHNIVKCRRRKLRMRFAKYNWIKKALDLVTSCSSKLDLQPCSVVSSQMILGSQKSQGTSPLA